MLDTLTFMLTLVFVTGILAGLTALILVTFVFNTKSEAQNMYAPITLNTVSTMKDTIDIATAGPLAVVSYSMTNVAATILIIACFVLHVEMDGREDRIMASVAPVYLEVNAVWMNAFIDPLVGFIAILYGAVVPAANAIIMIVRELLYATIQVLGSSAADPFHVFKAFLSIPMATGKLAKAFTAVFDTSQGGSWMVNTFDVQPAIQTIQTDFVMAIATQTQFLCRALIPPVAVATDVLTSQYLRGLIDSVINIPFRFVQLWAKVGAPQFNTFDVRPLFTELRAFAVLGGGVLDDLLQAGLNLGTMHIDALGKVALPRPSAGTALGRGLAAFLSIIELPINIIEAVLEERSVYDVSSAAQIIKQSHLAATTLTASIDAVKTLVYTGHIGKKTRLDCNYYGYNFFADANIKGSIPETCICEHGKCGNGICNDEGACECSPGYHNVIPGSRAAICVKTCQKSGQDFRDTDPGQDELADGLLAAKCGKSLGGGNAAGVCMDTGYCKCVEAAAVINLETGRCQNAAEVTLSYDDPDQMPKEEWGEGRCVALTTHDMGPVTECAVQSILLAGIGAAYTGYEFLRELIFRFPMRFTQFDQMLQTFDGMWYPRMDSISCEYRRDHSGNYDRTILPSNCMCDDPEYDDTDLVKYDPYCARPTLNANVYSHMDAFAFYAGKKLPVKQFKHIKYIFAGGTGAQFGFLSDTLGVYTTTAGRGAVETLRIVTHVLSGMLTYVLSVGALVAQGHKNMLQLPTNCEWGIEFDGPVPPKYTTENWTEAVADFIALKTTCYPGAEHCSGSLSDRIAVIEAMMPTIAGQMTPTQGTALVNRMHTATTIYNRNNEPSLAKCKDRAYDSKYLKCTKTNAAKDCICNPALDIDDTMKCRCMAMYPFIEAQSQDMQAYFKSDYLAKYYGQDIPWCYSMLLEHHYFYELSSSVAIQNIFARMASSSPLSEEIDSQCYSGDRTYQLSTTSALTRMFQPNPSSTGYVFVGGQGGSIANTTICQTLKALDEIRWIKDNDHGGVDFASAGACFAKDHPQDDCIEGARPLRLLALRDFDNPYVKKDMICYQVPKTVVDGKWFTGRDHLLYKTPVSTIKSVIEGYFKGNYKEFCKVAMKRGFTAAHGFKDVAKANMEWVNITAYRAKLVGYRISTDTVQMHPKTCGFMTQNDQLVFQPCRYKCLTDGGFDTCWCNVTVHHDVRCNAGEYYRKSAWDGIDMDRQMSTSVVSMLAMIPEGIRKDKVGLMCARFRAKGSEVAIVASMLTMNSDGRIADELRERVARLFFTFWEVIQMSSKDAAGRIKAKATKTLAWLDMDEIKLPEEMKGIKSLESLAMESVGLEVLRGLFPANLAAKACRFGKNACMKCATEEDCQSRGTPTYCYARGECPEDPHTPDAQPGYCCSRICEVTGTCPPSHLCSRDTCPTNFDCPTNGTDWCRGGVSAASDARACNYWPRTNNYLDKCYKRDDEGIVRCIDLNNCNRYKCMASAMACPAVVNSLGKVLTVYLFKEYMFKAVDMCTVLDALQKLVFSTSISGDGAGIIPSIQDLINALFEILDRTFANLMILVTQVVAGLVGIISHPGDLRAWGSWLKSFWTLFMHLLKIIFAHSFDFIQIGLAALPAPIGPIVSELIGSICYAIHKAFELTFGLLAKVPGLGSIGGQDWGDANEKCFNRLTTETTSPLIQADHARRRLHGRPLDEAGRNETEYHHWRDVVDWTGNTTCARIGRHPEAPDSQVGYEIWYECLMNRQRVAIIRALMGKAYIPWTFLDDWMEPLKFGVKFMHGIGVYLTEGEGVLRKWELLGYPTEASIDAIQYIDGWQLPKAPLQVALDLIPHQWPDYLHNKDGVGHNLYAVLATMKSAKIPSFRGQDWGALHTKTYDTILQIAGGITLPRGSVKSTSAPKGRRLSTITVGEQPTWAKEQDMCFEGGKGCMDCAVLTGALDNIIESVERAGNYYSNKYPETVTDFFDTVAHWESTNEDRTTAIFPDVTIAYRPKPALPRQPSATLQMAYAKVIADVDWTQIAKDFFTITDDTQIDVLEHSLWWYLKYPLRPCEAMRMVYDSCDAPKYSTADAAAFTFHTMGAFWTTGWITGLQLPLLLQVPLASGLFLIFRYDYVPRCLPLMPVCLMRDVQYMITQLTPKCICQAVPELVVNQEMCTDEYCTEATIVYRACPTRALGVLWAPAFLLRWQLPSVFEYLSVTLESNEEIAAMREDMEKGVPISPLDTTCAQLGLVSVLMVIMGIRIGFVFASSLIRPIMKATCTSVGSITMLMPFLLITVPKMLYEQIIDPGILIRGWE